MRDLKVLVIQPDALSPPALIGEILRERGIALHIVNTDVGESLPHDPMAFAGLLILGGRQSVLDEDQQGLVRTVTNIVRGYHQSGRPILGICLGAQLIATAFGARVQRVGELQFGFIPVQRRDGGQRDPLVRDMRDDQRVFTWHEDSSELPAGAVHLLASDTVSNYGYRVGQNTWGFQCHPEVRSNELQISLERGGHLVTKHLGERGHRRLENIDEEIEKYLGFAMQFGAMIANGWADQIVRTSGSNQPITNGRR